MSRSARVARAAAVAAAVTLPLAATTPARADAGDARAHFAAGVKLYDARPPDYAGALAEFEAALAEKPSPGIRRNIALCLRGLARYPEAIDALEAMLADAGSTLDPSVRAAAERTIAELAEHVAHLRVRVVLHAPPDAAPPTHAPVALAIDDGAPQLGQLGTTLRLSEGDHTVRAQADGFADAVETITLRGGAERTLTLDMTSTLPASPDEAPALPVSDAPAPLPPRYAREVPDVTLADVEPPRPWYGFVGVAAGTESRRVTDALDEPAQGTARDFASGALLVKAGRTLGRHFDVEAFGELGRARPSTPYASPNRLDVPADLAIVTWALAPELRVHTTGIVRFVAGAAVGVSGQSVTARLAQADGRVDTRKGGGLGGLAVFEAGAQLAVDRFLAEASAFVDARGVSSARADGGERMFDDGTVGRVGVRLLVGVTF